MKETALELFENSDSFATIQFLNRQPNSQAVTQAYNDLVRHLFWEKKNVPAVVGLSLAGIQYGLDAAHRARDAERAANLKRQARAIAYNLASFTWPGWEDEGIELNATDVAVGYDAAKVSLRLVTELDEEAIRYCRAHWMLGAHQLEAAESELATENFRKSAEFARVAETRAEELLAQGFALVAQSQRSQPDAYHQADLEAIVVQLSEEKHGQGFIEQIEAALRIYGR